MRAVYRILFSLVIPIRTLLLLLQLIFYFTVSSYSSSCSSLPVFLSVFSPRRFVPLEKPYRPTRHVKSNSRTENTSLTARVRCLDSRCYPSDVFGCLRRPMRSLCTGWMRDRLVRRTADCLTFTETVRSRRDFVILIQIWGNAFVVYFLLC